MRRKNAILDKTFDAAGNRILALETGKASNLEEQASNFIFLHLLNDGVHNLWHPTIHARPFLRSTWHVGEADDDISAFYEAADVRLVSKIAFDLGQLFILEFYLGWIPQQRLHLVASF